MIRKFLIDQTYYMIKKCKRCGNSGPFTKSKKHLDGLFPICKICKNQQHSEYRKSNKSNYDSKRKKWLKDNKEQQRKYKLEQYYKYRSTPNGRASQLLTAARKRIGSKNVTADREKISKIIKDGHCQKTGIVFDMLSAHGPFSPSIDRINPNESYTNKNIQIVVLIYNSAKGEWHHSDVMRLSASLTGQVSHGDLLDRISILKIKNEKISDKQKLKNVTAELQSLQLASNALFGKCDVLKFQKMLRKINEKIWDIEDNIRDHEHRNDFGQSFIQLARAIYHTNDRRAAIKKEINEMFGSDIAEAKSYTEYS